MPKLFSEVTLGFAVALVLLTAVSLTSIKALDAARPVRERARHAAQVRESLVVTLSALKDVEAGAQGYALTTHKSFLKPYDQSVRELEEDLVRLDVLLNDDLLQAKLFNELKRLTRELLAGSTEIIATAGRPSRAAERDRLLASGDALLYKARLVTEALVARETRIEAELLTHYEDLALLTRRAIYVALALALGLFAAGGLVLYRQISAREAMAAEVQESQEQLQALFDNTPAVVYVKDDAGRYRFVNRRFKQLFEDQFGPVIGKTNVDFWPARFAEAFSVHDERVRREGNTLECEEVAPHKDGPHTYLSLKFPLPSISEKLVCGVSMDITERKRAESLKSEVIAMASHELRTPLTIIMSALRHLLTSDPPLVSPEGRPGLDMALRNNKHLLAIINNYLDLAAIDSGVVKIESGDVDLKAVALEAVESMRHFDEARGLRFSIDAKPCPLVARGDASRVREVIDNLLSNAAKFSPNGAEIELALAARGERCQVSVRDHGPGIRKEFAPQIFHKFARDAVPEGFAKGTGLGLTIAKSLVERMDGSIWFETREGAGTTFLFDLPAASVGKKT